MTNHREEPYGEGSAGRYHTLQPERDPEANWEVDLAKKLGEYLLKICSGEITGDDGQVPVNFAEAALLLQGSVQVYSRKVEYLHSLVVHALEFIYQNRHQDQPDGTTGHPEESSYHAAPDGENDVFWGLDDVPVEAQNCLDNKTSKDAPLNSFVKPPANLVVLEGDCLDACGDDGELESYLLATSDLYQDFILLDLCDAVAVPDYNDGKELNSCYRGRSSRKSYFSPSRCSEGTARKSTRGKNRDVDTNPFPRFDNDNMRFVSPVCDDYGNTYHGSDMDDRDPEPHCFDDSDDDDPWKPLNPHEPGNLKVKPFCKAKVSMIVVTPNKKPSIATLFPPAKLLGIICPELTEIWEARCRDSEKRRDSDSPPLLEKLRQNIVNGGRETCDDFSNPEYDNDDNGFHADLSDFDQPSKDMPENMCMDEDVSFYPEKNDIPGTFGTNEYNLNEDPNSRASLEDLCRSHLDALLASIAENEKQTDLSARVANWKQNIEHNLEAQDQRTPFDIHHYGERILEKLSLETDNGNEMSLTDVVKGQEKHDVARSFSALLQLVNNGEVHLDTMGMNGQSVCYTAVNPFRIKLLGRDNQRRGGIQIRSSKKRAKSPTKEGYKNGKVKSVRVPVPAGHAPSSSSIRISPRNLPQSNHKVPMTHGENNVLSRSSHGKRKRRALVEAIDLNSAI